MIDDRPTLKDEVIRPCFCSIQDYSRKYWIDRWLKESLFRVSLNSRIDRLICSIDPKGDAWLVKIDADGNHIWNKTFGDELHDTIESLIETPEGDLVMGGSYGATNEWNEGSPQLWLFKTNMDGELQWEKIIQIDRSDIPIKYYMAETIQTDDGGFVIVADIDTRKEDLCLIKTDGNGQKEWEKYIQMDQSIEGGFGTDILQASDGSLVISKNEHTGDKWDVRLMKTVSIHQYYKDSSDDGFLGVNVVIVFWSLIALGILNSKIKRKRKG